MKVLILFAFVLATASAASLLNTLVKPLDESLVQPLKPILEGPEEQPLKQSPEQPLPEAEQLKDEKEGRITNGWAAANGQFPYQAGLLMTRHDGSSWCGGTLIGHNWVLSAAHCTNGAHTVNVYLGDVRVYGGVQVTASGGNIYQHPWWDGGAKSDISLINIPHVGFNHLIQAAHMPNENWAYTGWQAIASGWGEIWQGSGVVQELRFTSQRIIENWECLRSFGSVIDEGAICVSTPRDSSTCFGDSGGPLVLEGTWTVVGVCSFLNWQGCHSGEPAGFMRVGAYRDWIRGITGL